MRFLPVLVFAIMCAAGEPAHTGTGPHAGHGKTHARESAPTRSTQSPPLFRISKPGFVAYLLPESHVGSPIEFALHYHRVVLPAARRSHTLVVEAANLDTFPGSPYWGRTCLDDRPELVAFGPELVKRIAAHHRHSQWADLRRAFAVKGETFAEEQFTTFIGTRGLMINFWELDSRVGALLEAELAMRQATQPKVTAREYLIEHGVQSRIRKAIPRLSRESIETLDDEAWAICTLPPALQREAIALAIESFDQIEPKARRRVPGNSFRQAEAIFRVLDAQLRASQVRPTHSVSAQDEALVRLGPDEARVHLPGLSRGKALDTLKLGLRNQRWADRINEHSRARRQGLFYVLGAAHLLDFDDFDGLLTLLRERGFRIELVP